MTVVTNHAASERAKEWLRRLAVAAAFSAVVLFYYWTVKTSAAGLRIDGERRDYYNLLVDGFQRGNLFMDAPVHPELLALPEDRRPGNAPYLLDASLYQGNYYLYFGVVPAVLLYWPFATVTGHDLPEAWAALMVATLGFFFATWWWLDVRKRFFPRLGIAWTVLGILAIGVATAVPSTLRRPMFYEVAIGAGYAFTMLTVWAVTRARLQSERQRCWLVVAGIAGGLAVGCRANLAPALVAMLAVGCLICAISTTKAVAGASRLRRIMRLGVLAGCGFGAIALALGAYNYARFGDVREFGHSYQLGVVPQKMFRTTNLEHNLRIYYLSPPALNGYFPFVAPADEPPKPPDYVGREHAHGEWIWSCVTLVALAGAVFTIRRRSEEWREVALLGSPLLAAFIVSTLVVSLTAVRANRYMLDFHPLLVLGTLLLLASVAGRSARLAGSILILASLVFNVFASMQVHGFFRYSDPAAYAKVARKADGVLWPLLREADAVSDREVTITWPATLASRSREPIFSAGPTWFDDVLWADYRADGKVRLIYAHGEMGGAYGDWFPITPGGVSRVRLSGAVLLPPVGHPAFGHQPMGEQRFLKRSFQVVVDGQVRFERDVPSFPSSPRLHRWGKWRRPDGEVFRFGGKIENPEPLAVGMDRIRSRGAEEGAFRFRLELPQVMFGFGEPLLQSGSAGAFDMLAIKYVRPGVAQLIHDKAGSGARYSEEFDVDYTQMHLVEVEYPFAGDGIEWLRDEPALKKPPAAFMRVWWDGALVFESDLPPHPASAGEVTAGYNEWNSTICRMMFTGPAFEVLRFAPLEQVRAGPIRARLPDVDILRKGARGVLLRFTAPESKQAALVWRISQGFISFGWLEETGTTWSQPVSLTDAGRAELDVLLPATDPSAETKSGWIDLSVGGNPVAGWRASYFSRGVVACSGLVSCGWSTTASRDGSAAATVANGGAKSELPGRVSMRLGLPPKGLPNGSDPLLFAGKPGAGDSLYLRVVGPDTYILGVDHWGVGVVESKPVVLPSETLHTLVIELGSFFAGGEIPPDTVRLQVNGEVVLNERMPLYPVTAEGIVWGGNPHGMSTSGSTFRGEIVSLRFRENPATR